MNYIVKLENPPNDRMGKIDKLREIPSISMPHGPGSLV